MLRFALLSAVGLPLLLLGSGTANASCVTNPAICRAICGCSCCTTRTGCGSGGFTTPTGRNLSRFSVGQLTREANSIGDARVRGILRAEIRRRRR